jgi:signal transduction histidine kinase
MGTARRTWVLYIAALTAVVAILVVLSGIVLTLERDAGRARARRAAAKRLQEALWRLDAYVVPVLGRQAALAYSHYVPAFVPTRLYAPDGTRRGSGEVLLEVSPILTTEWPDWVLLHWSAPVEGGIASPELPTGRHRWVRAEREMKPEALERKARLLKQVGAFLGAPARKRLAARAGGHQAMWARDVTRRTRQVTVQTLRPRPRPRPRPEPTNVARANTSPDNENRRRLFRRGQAQVQLPEPLGNTAMNMIGPLPKRKQPGMVGLGALRPFKKTKKTVEVVESSLVQVDVSDVSAAWVDRPSAEPALILYRRATVQGRQVLQGSLVDWERLRAALAAEVEDLYPDGVTLRPRRGAPRTTGGERLEDELSTLPVVLSTGIAARDVLPFSEVTPVRAALLVTWALALVALLVTGLAVRGTADLARRRMNFVSAVSHELRAPLTGLRMYLDMLAEGMITDEGKRAEVLRTLQGQAERLGGLVRGVLDYSRLERQTFQAHRRETTTRALFAELERACRDRCAASKVALEVDARLAAQRALETDPEAVLQIVLNLVDNACKYGGDAGPVRLSAEERDEALVIRVEDDGPGIPPRARRRLFTAFFRAGDEMTREHPGVGLGLAIARGFADAIGARLELVGQPNEGGNLRARFELGLPWRV